MKIVAGLKYENDSNPSQDIGIPVKIGDIEIQGVIDDSQQADTRISQNLLALLSYGTINAFIGVNQTSYSKSLYKKLKSQVIFAETGSTPKFTRDGWVHGVCWTSLKVGPNTPSITF